MIVINAVESTRNYQAAKKYGVTECLVRKWRTQKERPKSANTMRKAVRGYLKYGTILPKKDEIIKMFTNFFNFPSGISKVFFIFFISTIQQNVISVQVFL